MSPYRCARAPVAVILAALCAALLPWPAAAAPESREVSGGRLDWGVKSSFQSYVTGPVARGSWELLGGAATVGSSQFRFHSAKGTYTPDKGAFEAGFSGGVRFTGHRKPDGSSELDLTIARPAVRIEGTGGTLLADITGKARGTGEVTSRTRVPLAALDLTGADLRGAGTTVSLTGVPAKLTAEGAEAFAGYYTAGTQLDPVTLSADLVTGPAARNESPSPSGPPAGQPAERGEFTGAAVDWGVRRTFREYVTGPIAQGSWTVADGAREGGALFRFTDGKGRYEDRGAALAASFAGTLRFTGKDLDLTLSGVEVEVRHREGTLSARVGRAGSAPGKAVPLVTFDAAGLRQKDGLASVTEAPAKLTAQGAGAFGGLYREGAAMDPVSLAVPLTAGAPVPPLPDVGHGPLAAPGAAAREDGGSSSSSSSSSSDDVPLIAGVAGGAVLLAAAGYAVVRMRRKRSA
ncbi:HtaA domain-containing protein [Streptomyces caatingaensis]|uniref:Htaa domain protein n=1 Tax=Streptomyces caatingaensis TaxID=1678637 RepID=A0A0K9XHI4_9ACTN|nr:HtaA domain-containing protein [Streptomyces caatingaensis]KNB52859.1 Htaa domain protein [Streptomyces caatingaensis]